jgi:hypothetical protein
MRRLLIVATITGALLAVPAVPALADISTTQTLPTAACTNSGTPNAHSHIPPVPGTANVTPCGHGG